jgi:hypothetical protein
LVSASYEYSGQLRFGIAIADSAARRSTYDSHGLGFELGYLRVDIEVDVHVNIHIGVHFDVEIQRVDVKDLC